MATKKVAKTSQAKKKIAEKKVSEKKVSARKTKAVKTPTKSEEVTQASRSTQSTQRSLNISRRNIIILLVGVVILGLLYYFKSAFIVATVNGEPISRLTYIHEMEHQIGQPGLKSGTQALNTVVTKTLILQEAKKKNVTVSDDEINAELSKVEQSLKGSGQTLDQALASEGITRKDYSEQIKFQKLVEKLAGANVTVTDKEVEEYMTQNKESLPTTTEASEAAALKTQVKNQLKSQKESSKIQAWLQGLQKNAKINYYSDVAPQTSL